MEDNLYLFREYESIIYEIVFNQFYNEDFSIYLIKAERYIPNEVYSNKHKFIDYLFDISIKLDLYEFDRFGLDKNEYYNFLDKIKKNNLVSEAFKSKEHPVFACQKIYLYIEKSIETPEERIRVKNDKYIQEFFCQDDKIKELVDILTNKIKVLSLRLQEINLLNSNENIKYRENFLENDTKNVLMVIYLHLEMIYDISKSYETVCKCLKYIVELFPTPTDVKNDKIDANQYKKYVFPLNFVDLINDNFYSKLNKKSKNKIIFENENLRREIDFKHHEINYIKFIDGVFEIIQNGYIISNDAGVSANSTYINGRKG